MENPVLVFLPEGSFRSTKRTSWSCLGDAMLNSCPQRSQISPLEPREPEFDLGAEDPEFVRVDGDAGPLHRREHGDEGHFDVAEQLSEARGLQFRLHEEPEAER